MNSMLLRLVLLLLHAFINFALVSWLLNFDITGSWLAVGAFVIGVLLLMVVFIRHLLSFFSFLKTRTK